MYHRYFFTVLQVYITLMSKVTNITITLNILVYGQKHLNGKKEKITFTQVTACVNTIPAIFITLL
jgi:hypothetical protein